MVALGRVEALATAHLGNDRRTVAARLAKLADVGAACCLLARVIDEDRRAVLAAVIGPLAVELGRVVHHREEHLHQLSIADLARVVVHLHRFGVAGAATADALIAGIGGTTPDVTGHRVAHPFDVLEHALHAPETPTGEDHAGVAGVIAERRIAAGRRQRLHLRRGLGRCGHRTAVHQQYTRDQRGGNQAGDAGGNALFEGEFHHVLPVQPKVKA
ncbi:hypothetical protein D3C73_1108750 [compost metagenome]